ncbi:MAG: rhodanese-like domain-containing protein [Gammaproteobacteria bacterium]|nr:rhodanese-like domain-containing protein [Gammaproteobacteria bacterium]
MASIEVIHNGAPVTIQRIQNQSNILTGGFARTSRKCPPFCIQPMQVATGVTSVAEIEVLKFMQSKLNNGTGLVIDARTPDWHKKGTIPGSINIPFTVFDHSEYHPQLRDAMSKLGVKLKPKGNSLGGDLLVNLGLKEDNKSPWDFSAAKDILLWCNGMWCGQSPRAIRNLLKQGYPANKIYYYRGGMQSWQILGLTIVIP